jgi:hypothetical protein
MRAEARELRRLVRMLRRLTALSFVVVVVALAVTVAELGWAAVPMMPTLFVALSGVVAARLIISFAEWRPGTGAYFARTGRWTMEGGADAGRS